MSSIGSSQERLERTQARANVYALLSVCLYEPTLRLTQDLLAGSLAAAFRESLEALPEARFLEAKIAAVDQSGEEFRPQDGKGARSLLGIEYLRLFVGPDHLPCPPYESVYRVDVPAQQRGLLMGKATADALQTYRQAGLDLAADHKDLPDHIGTELEFMHFLCQKEAEAWERADGEQAEQWGDMQQRFLAEHLSVWVPAFCEAVQKASRVRFYRDLAGLLEDYVALEARGPAVEP